LLLKLENIASIQTGVYARPLKHGEIVYLQSKHFNENGALAQSLYPDLDKNTINPRHILKAGDVLFAAKGFKNFAAVYEAHNPPAVASTSFFVIRLENNQVLPEYLAWFMNHPETQKKLKLEAKGSAIVSIPKTELEDLDIEVPPLQTQEYILKLDKLRKEERRIKSELEDLQERYIQQLLIKAVKA
jgi:restriction endonuclease S subunit